MILLAPEEPAVYRRPCLSSLILSRPDRLPTLLPMLMPTLISRFREREENVKMDVFATFNDLLHQVAAKGGDAL